MWRQLLQTLNNSVRGEAKVSRTSLISVQSSLDLNSCRYLSGKKKSRNLSQSKWQHNLPWSRGVSSTSWRGSVQSEGRHWWCESLHFGSGSPFQSRGQAISEGNPPFQLYWWRRSTVETHTIKSVISASYLFSKYKRGGCTCFWICSGLVSIKFIMFALIAVRSGSDTLFGSSSTF